MATSSFEFMGIGGSGWDPGMSFLESGNSYLWNKWSADDAQERAKEAALLGYFLHQQSLRDSPSAAVEGLEKAGLNPILAANSSAGAYNASVGPGSPLGVSPGSAESGFHGNPLQRKREEAAIDQATSAADAQKSLKNLYEAQAERLRYMPLTESDNGGLSVFGTGFNAGGTDTLLFDTRTGKVIRPKDTRGGTNETFNPSPSSAGSLHSSQQPNVSPTLQRALEKKGLSFKDLWNVE